MTPPTLSRQDLLFHPSHGLCRVDTVTRKRGNGPSVLCYSLVPKVMSRMKVRFVVAAPDLRASGFHKIISAREAKKILDYLKAGDGRAEQSDQTWALARNILSFSKERSNPRDQRQRQLLEHSVKGLVGELACVLQLDLKKTTSLVRKNLAHASRENAFVIAALGRAAEE